MRRRRKEREEKDRQREQRRKTVVFVVQSGGYPPLHLFTSITIIINLSRIHHPSCGLSAS